MVEPAFAPRLLPHAALQGAVMLWVALGMGFEREKVKGRCMQLGTNE